MDSFCLTSGDGSSWDLGSLWLILLVPLDGGCLVISAYEVRVCSRPLESTIFPIDTAAGMVAVGVGDALLELVGVCFCVDLLGAVTSGMPVCLEERL